MAVVCISQPPVYDLLVLFVDCSTPTGISAICRYFMECLLREEYTRVVCGAVWSRKQAVISAHGDDESSSAAAVTEWVATLLSEERYEAESFRTLLNGESLQSEADDDIKLWLYQLAIDLRRAVRTVENSANFCWHHNVTTATANEVWRRLISEWADDQRCDSSFSSEVKNAAVKLLRSLEIDNSFLLSTIPFTGTEIESVEAAVQEILAVGARSRGLDNFLRFGTRVDTAAATRSNETGQRVGVKHIARATDAARTDTARPGVASAGKTRLRHRLAPVEISAVIERAEEVRHNAVEDTRGLQWRLAGTNGAEINSGARDSASLQRSEQLLFESIQTLPRASRFGAILNFLGTAKLEKSPVSELDGAFLEEEQTSVHSETNVEIQKWFNVLREEFELCAKDCATTYMRPIGDSLLSQMADMLLEAPQDNLRLIFCSKTFPERLAMLTLAQIVRAPNGKKLEEALTTRIVGDDVSYSSEHHQTNSSFWHIILSSLSPHMSLFTHIVELNRADNQRNRGSSIDRQTCPTSLTAAFCTAVIRYGHEAFVRFNSAASDHSKMKEDKTVASGGGTAARNGNPLSLALASEDLVRLFDALTAARLFLLFELFWETTRSLNEVPAAGNGTHTAGNGAPTAWQRTALEFSSSNVAIRLGHVLASDSIYSIWMRSMLSTNYFIIFKCEAARAAIWVLEFWSGLAGPLGCCPRTELLSAIGERCLVDIPRVAADISRLTNVLRHQEKLGVRICPEGCGHTMLVYKEAMFAVSIPVTSSSLDSFSKAVQLFGRAAMYLTDDMWRDVVRQVAKGKGDLAAHGTAGALCDAGRTVTAGGILSATGGQATGDERGMRAEVLFCGLLYGMGAAVMSDEEFDSSTLSENLVRRRRWRNCSLYFLRRCMDCVQALEELWKDLSTEECEAAKMSSASSIAAAGTVECPSWRGVAIEHLQFWIDTAAVSVMQQDKSYRGEAEGFGTSTAARMLLKRMKAKMQKCRSSQED